MTFSPNLKLHIMWLLFSLCLFFAITMVIVDWQGMNILPTDEWQDRLSKNKWVISLIPLFYFIV